jgi:arylformamidase
MRVYDLSHDIRPNMPVFPGMSQPKLEKPFAVASHGYAETLLTMLSHTGTHMDAPAHMNENGKTLDSYPASSFIGKAMVIEVQDKHEIDLKFLKQNESQIKGLDFILFHTGWSRLWGSNNYFTGFPALTVDAAEWLSVCGIKGIGLDCISADVAESTDFPVHHRIFKEDLLIVENLKNLDKLLGKIFFFSCLPLKYENADGSPVRAIAWI